jgi:PAS domain S-box-containing protein
MSADAKRADAEHGDAEHAGLTAHLQSELLRLSHDAIFVWRPGGVIEFWNRGAEELYGYSSAEALGHRPAELLASGPLAQRAEIGASLRSAGQWAGELEHRCKDGRRVTVSSRMQMVLDGGIERILETNRDITEAKRAQYAREEVEQRLRIALDSSGVSFSIFAAVRDESGRIVDFMWTYVNADCCRRLQRPPEALVGHRVLDVLPRAWEPVGLFDALCRTVETGTQQEIEVAPGPYGVKRWYHNIMTKLGDGVAVWFADITERKLGEQALRDADRRKDEFLATLAHELRNPLAPIRNGLAILKLAVPMQGTVKRTTDMMDRQLTHLVRLIDDLLDVSRITRGKMELRVRPVALNEVLAATLESCRGQLETKHLALETSIGREPLLVEGDPDRLMQVFSNLLTNAINYTESGGLIRVAAGREGSEAVVSVEDTGIGIPAGALESVFEMFAQLHPGGQGEAGLGIGLALVRQLVEMHGGTVRASSSGVGCGSAFVVRLPISAQPAIRSMQ